MTLAQAPCTALIGRDSLARITPAETASGQPITTARRLVEVSVSPNTRRAYLAALHAATRGRLDAVIAGLLFMGGTRRSEVPPVVGGCGRRRRRNPRHRPPQQDEPGWRDE